jgi:hypothetical protein
MRVKRPDTAEWDRQELVAVIGGVTQVVIEVEAQDRAKAQDLFCPSQSMPMAT